MALSSYDKVEIIKTLRDAMIFAYDRIDGGIPNVEGLVHSLNDYVVSLQDGMGASRPASASALRNSSYGSNFSGSAGDTTENANVPQACTPETSLLLDGWCAGAGHTTSIEGDNADSRQTDKSKTLFDINKQSEELGWQSSARSLRCPGSVSTTASDAFFDISREEESMVLRRRPACYLRRTESVYDSITPFDEKPEELKWFRQPPARYLGRKESVSERIRSFDEKPEELKWFRQPPAGYLRRKESVSDSITPFDEKPEELKRFRQPPARYLSRKESVSEMDIDTSFDTNKRPDEFNAFRQFSSRPLRHMESVLEMDIDTSFDL